MGPISDFLVVEEGLGFFPGSSLVFLIIEGGYLLLKYRLVIREGYLEASLPLNPCLRMEGFWLPSHVARRSSHGPLDSSTCSGSDRHVCR